MLIFEFVVFGDWVQKYQKWFKLWLRSLVDIVESARYVAASAMRTLELIRMVIIFVPFPILTR